MVGIKAVGTYLPLWRLGPGTKGWQGRSERSVAGFDEDSITMAVAAVMDCLGGIDRSCIDGLYFATTTSPYLEKQASVVIATAADLRTDILTADFTGSLRAGTTALNAAIDAVKAGSAKQIVVVAADVRKAPARSDMETTFGDGAVAVLVSNAAGLATIDDSFTVAHEIHDIWRLDQNETIVSAEDRFAFDEGYFKAVPKAVSTLLKKNSLTPADLAKAAVSGPDSRRHAEMAKMLGLKPEQLSGTALFNSVGNTGAAFALMMLVEGLAAGKAKEKALLANYGNGADVFLLTLNKPAAKSLKSQIDSKRLVDEYMKYAQWRGFMEFTPPYRRPVPLPPAATALFREQARNLRFQGSKCRSCGYEQFPPQIICTKCQARNSSDPVRFADKKGSLFTYSTDYINPSLNPPTTVAMVNFSGGGRTILEMTDYDVNELRVDLPVEMTFRRLYTAGDIHNYFWKCRPVRAKGEK